MSSPARLLGIAAVFAICCVGWLVLGNVTSWRSHAQSNRLASAAADLWGSAQRQQAPVLQFEWTKEEVQQRTETRDGKAVTISEKVIRQLAEPRLPASTDVAVDLRSDPRRKGLIWYAFYDLGFTGRWTYRHEGPGPGQLRIVFAFPDPGGLYDGFRFVVNGEDLARRLRPQDGRVAATVPVEPGRTTTLEVSYRTRGSDAWSYAPADGVANVEDFTLDMTTDFDGYDFPAGTLSPSTKERDGSGWRLRWRFEQVITGHAIGLAMPQRIQPGDLASALSFSAPISLLFFFLLLAVRTNLRGIDVHPVNYLFLGAAFFAFHLLFAYLVDHVAVIPAFAAASAVSILLVVSYLRLVVSIRFAFVEALSQLVFLVGFSLAHFAEGFTGLTVTILSILTLFVLMQLTGRIRWSAPPKGAVSPASG